MISPLRVARESRGETLQAVAIAIGVDPGNLSRIERGTQTPSKDLIERLVRYYGGEVSEVEIIFPERFAA